MLNKCRVKKKRTVNRLKNALLSISLREKRHFLRKKRYTKREWRK